MSILKLEPGQKVNLTVTGATEVEGKFGPQIKFTGATPDDADAVLFLNVDTAFKQLGRIGFAVDSVIGSTVEIERVEKNGTKFTNINKARGTVAAPRTAPAKAPVSLGGPLPWEQPSAPLEHPEYGDEAAQQKAVDALKADRLNALFTLYRTCFAEAASVAKGLPNATPEAVAAMTATLFIAAKDRAA